MMYLCALCPAPPLVITCIDPKRPPSDLGWLLLASGRDQKDPPPARQSITSSGRGHERYDELAHDRTDRWKRSSRDRSVATWHTKDRMVGGTRDLFREASSTEASSSLGSGQITKGLTESQRPVPDIMSQRRSPRVKRNAAVTSLFNVVKVCRLYGLPYLR